MLIGKKVQSESAGIVQDDDLDVFLVVIEITRGKGASRVAWCVYALFGVARGVLN